MPEAPNSVPKDHQKALDFIENVTSNVDKAQTTLLLLEQLSRAIKLAKRIFRPDPMLEKLTRAVKKLYEVAATGVSATKNSDHAGMLQIISLAPEYAYSRKLTERSDVYSSGVVLLELITGRKPVDMSGDENLVEWARPLLTQALETENSDSLTDPRLEKNYNEGEMFRMIETAATCIRHSAPMRPQMGLVMRALDGSSDVNINNGLKPGEVDSYLYMDCFE